jgi:hypothetical protein
MVNIYIPSFLYSNNFRTFILAVLISILIVFSVVNKFNASTFIIIITLTVLILIIMNSSIGMNLAGSLPSTTYPIPPHLGLDGISLVNRN